MALFVPITRMSSAVPTRIVATRPNGFGRVVSSCFSVTSSSITKTQQQQQQSIRGFKLLSYRMFSSSSSQGRKRPLLSLSSSQSSSSLISTKITTTTASSFVGCRYNYLSRLVQQRNYNRRTFTTSSNNTNNNNNNNTSLFDQIKGWWIWYTGPKIMPERHTAAWYREMILICTVFGITGSSTMVLVRPAVSKGLGINGSFKDGPWSYRICSIVIMTPIYATLLVVVGTVFGRHVYFRHFAIKIFTRFGIPPEALDKNYHITKSTFKKW